MRTNILHSISDFKFRNSLTQPVHSDNSPRHKTSKRSFAQKQAWLSHCEVDGFWNL